MREKEEKGRFWSRDFPTDKVDAMKTGKKVKKEEKGGCPSLAVWLNAGESEKHKGHKKKDASRANKINGKLLSLEKSRLRLA